jgi:hypothetical protein
MFSRHKSSYNCTLYKHISALSTHHQVINLYIHISTALLFHPKLTSVLSCIDCIQIIIIIKQFMLLTFSFHVYTRTKLLGSLVCYTPNYWGGETLVAGLCPGVMKILFLVAVLTASSCVVRNIY